MKICVTQKDEKVKISKYLQGQFAEHLGRGIYGGLWVGKESDIPNINGIRSDIVEALALATIKIAEKSSTTAGVAWLKTTPLARMNSLNCAANLAVKPTLT